MRHNFSRYALALTAVIFAGFYFIIFARGSDSNIIHLGDARFRYDTAAPELTGIRKLSRGALSSTRFQMRLVQDDPKTEFSFGISDANPKGQKSIIHPSSRRPYFGDCSYNDGPGGFRRLIKNDLCHNNPHTEAYLFKPGSREVIIVRCHRDDLLFCRMSFYDEIGPYDVRVNAAILENEPKDWLSVAADIRSFIHNHVTHLD